MKQKIIVSNIRIPEAYWLQAKSIASQTGISVNEYINRLIADSTVKKMMGNGKITKPKKSKSKSKTIYDALLKLSKMPNKPMGASEDDKIIYDI